MPKFVVRRREPTSHWRYVSGVQQNFSVQVSAEITGAQLCDSQNTATELARRALSAEVAKAGSVALGRQVEVVEVIERVISVVKLNESITAVPDDYEDRG